MSGFLASPDKAAIPLPAKLCHAARIVGVTPKQGARLTKM
jgi:hypothetical protein